MTLATHQKSPSIQVLVESPDTDIYHIGLPLPHQEQKDIIAEVNPYTTKETTVSPLFSSYKCPEERRRSILILT